MAEKTADAIKITNQFRSKNGFVYDLKSEDSRMTLSIAPRENADDAGEWRVEAQMKRDPDAVAIVGWGATRSDALRDVASSWTSRTDELGLPTFDWDAVARVLTEVRAL
jgi:hypothetical protein